MSRRVSTKVGASAVVIALAFAGALSACGDDSDDAGDSGDSSDTAFTRSAVNPWQWSVDLGFNQGELVSGATTTLHLAGQSAMSSDGQPMHDGDMAAQIELALDNLEEVLAEAGMDLGDVVHLNIYTTDVDTLFTNYGLIAGRLGAAGVNPPGSLLGVSRLAFPELMVELEATAQQ